MIKDNFGRTISYLRLSVTDRCNLRCFYCRPCQSRFMPHETILSYEEMIYLLSIFSEMDVQKVRLTGGEPFVRKDILYFLNRVKTTLPDLDMRLTTNATLIAGKIRALKDIGIKGLNISLDSLDRHKYQRITGMDCLDNVMASIRRCLNFGIRVKINVVALKGVNDDELSDFVNMAMELPVDIRFIEFMPIGHKTLWQKEHFWSADDIVSEVQNMVEIVPAPFSSLNHGPAAVYDLVEGQGRIGVISPLSNHFCGTCNRFRITADGRLRTCLFSDNDFRLLPLLRSKKISKERVRIVLERAGLQKPMGHEIMGARGSSEKSICSRIMSSIGG
ncbi:GTP 3',8-cyclase MoaA [Desulfonatronovibrio magnus]|uniref:GTP 3',8-cyclase MoaA n=1 Tax=Desulfonatronovibrio magnus TaxID=698827 RepID=UPI0005EAFEE0|nr:GTP 3',8-cyclase MoaA [Desulfonatronovibrio magnus]